MKNTNKIHKEKLTISDKIGIWSKALSTQEISDLYNGGAGNTMMYNTGFFNFM